MSAATVHVWLVDVDDEAAARASLSHVPAAERIRLGLLAQPHRRRNLCAQAALRILASAATTGVPPLPELVRSPGGKPVLTVPGMAAAPSATAPPLHLNLAHSGGLAAVALTTAGPVGVDVERLRALPDRNGLAELMLADRELRRWRRTGEPERDAAAFRAWTRKEAVLKALGTGLRGGLRSVSTRVSSTRESPVRLTSLPRGAGSADQWSVHDLPGAPGYLGAVAVRAPRVTAEQHETTIAKLLRAAPHPTEGDFPLPDNSHPRSAERSRPAVPGTPGRRVRLFCLPHAGGNSAAFRTWQWLAPHAEVVGVDLPGHGTRLLEPMVDQWGALVDDLTGTVAARIDGSYALFGHSLGSLLAYEVGRRLTRRGRPPGLLVVAGRNGPSAGLSHRPIHDLPDAQFVEALRRLGGMPEGLLYQPELLRMFLPLLRTDVRLAERYAPEPGATLRCPVVAFAGRTDRMTDEPGMTAWVRETTGTCELVFVDGGHFFVHEREFAEILAARIRRLGTGGGAPSPG